MTMSLNMIDFPLHLFAFLEDTFNTLLNASFDRNHVLTKDGTEKWKFLHWIYLTVLL